MNRPRRVSTPEDIDTLTVELYPEERKSAEPLELMPQADDPVRPITKPCAQGFNWPAFAVLMFDAFLWLCIIALIAWAYDDTATFLKGFKP